MRLTLLAGCAAVLFLLVAALHGQERKADDDTKVTLEPARNPAGIKVRLVAQKDTYRMPRDMLLDDKLERYPPAPEVDLVLEINNLSKEELHFTVAGDDARLLLDLQGPGAVSKQIRKGYGMVAHKNQRVAVGPGKTYQYPIKRLTYSDRDTNACYWTKAGDYTLAAGLATEFGWKNDQDEAIQLRRAVLASEPIKLKVRAGDDAAP
jgi:hypothetical protein